MAPKILCVAEKPAIAKSVAGHLSGGQFTTRAVNGNQYVKNYEFNFPFRGPWANSTVVMTSVIGHLTGLEFDIRFKNWQSCRPIELFDGRITEEVASDKQAIAANITQQARYSKALFIWTDCDREGEHIGSEVRNAALKGNPRLEVKRAKFSNTERAHIINAAHHPVDLNERVVSAVACRMELDLRLGASFTRFQTLNLQPLDQSLEGKVLSYGSCQFPTLGFVVDRYFRVRNFVPEKFWTLQVMHTRDDINVTFLWDRHRLFDRAITTILFERCLLAKKAKITKLEKKPTSKWRPLPLTTVELQKLGSMFLGMDSQKVMKIAEDLYTQGWISYPRTETDQFDKGIDLQRLVGKQTQDTRWGQYSQNLLDGAFRQPRAGRNNDQAHPPIHPVNYVASHALRPDEARVYEFITRRFLGCCSEDARGESTNVSLAWGPESFHASGLLVLQRNYLDVYTYDRWQSSQQLPNFLVGEEFEPMEAKMSDGETSPPGYLTEPELIALMDANGIGTDATMAEHIAKIKDREYVMTQPRSGARTATATRDGNTGRGRGRGGRGGRGGAHANGDERGRGGTQEFIPSTLGVALIMGYEAALSQASNPRTVQGSTNTTTPHTPQSTLSSPALTSGASTAQTSPLSSGSITSLAKPFLRKELEIKLKDICEGRKGKREVVDEVLEQYREVFILANRRVDDLKGAVRRYVSGVT
ncbi:DNA topoisomerase [Thelotrema lepadinum]|nr:DNA topoisomerase [Thelotrema lepadinum]